MDLRGASPATVRCRQRRKRSRRRRTPQLAGTWAPRTCRRSRGRRMRRSPRRPHPRSDTSNLPPAGHLGVLSLPKGLCYPLPQVSAQVPAPFGLVHWPFLTELKETTVAESGHLGPRVPRPWGRSQGLGRRVRSKALAFSPPPPPPRRTCAVSPSARCPPGRGAARL